MRHDRQDSDPQLDYAAEELVAESVAHLAVSFIGLDTSAAAVPYLASWAESAPADTFERIAGLVDRLARRLEQTLGAAPLTPAAMRSPRPRRNASARVTAMPPADAGGTVATALRSAMA